jgi:hypothetical protein
MSESAAAELKNARGFDYEQAIKNPLTLLGALVVACDELDAQRAEVARLEAELTDWKGRAERQYDENVAQITERARLTQENETLRAAAATVLDGFERGVFCRDTVNDSNPSWAIRLFPYITALSKLSAALTSPDAETP